MLISCFTTALIPHATAPFPYAAELPPSTQNPVPKKPHNPLEGDFLKNGKGHYDLTMKQPLLTQDRWITTRDVADRLSVHLNTVTRYVKSGAFGQILILSMKDKRIRESSLQRFIEERLV